MSESGSTQFPRISIGVETSKPQAGQGPSLLLVKLPSELQHVEKNITISGEIVEKKPDGTVRIKTDYGDIIAKPDRPINLRDGERVEVRIPRGDPPQTATVRQAPPTHPDQPQPAPEPQNYIKIPPVITPQQLKEIPHANLKPVQPQDIPKIIAPYTEHVKAILPPHAELVSNLVALLETPDSALPSKPLVIPSFAETSLPVPPLSSTPDAILPNNTPPADPIIVPKKMSSLLAKIGWNTAIPTETPQTNLNILPIIIPLKSVIASLIARPLEAPLPVATTLTLLTPPPVSEAFTLGGSITILSVMPPQITLSSTPVDNTPLPFPTDERGETFKTLVVGFTPEQNFPVLKIIVPERRADQFFALELPVRDLPIGTQIEFAQISSPPVTPATPSLITPLVGMLPSLALPESWSTLQEIQAALTQISPATARAFSMMMPHAGNPQQLAPTALFFLAALRSGDISSWLGEKTIDALKKMGKMELLSRLTRDFTNINRLSSEPLPQDWKMTNLPMAWDNDIYKIVIYYKQDNRNQQQDDKQNKGNTRFLMNLNLNAIGPVQIDGLFQGKEGTGRLDLILRTKTSFSEPMQAEMRRLYKSALDETRYTGELSFQNKPEQWVHITAYTAAQFQKEV